MTTLKPGDQAPEFIGIDQNGKNLGLRDFKGKKLILYFYPKDMTPGCTAEAQNLRDHFKLLQKKGYEIVGVSPDAPKRHVRFIEKYNLPFPLIADTEHKIADLYEVWGLKKFMGREYMGIYRTTFIIDEAGIIRHVIKKVKTKAHAEQILEEIERKENS